MPVVPPLLFDPNLMPVVPSYYLTQISCLWSRLTTYHFLSVNPCFWCWRAYFTESFCATDLKTTATPRRCSKIRTPTETYNQYASADVRILLQPLTFYRQNVKANPLTFYRQNVKGLACTFCR